MRDKEKIRKAIGATFGKEEAKVGNCHIFKRNKEWHMRRCKCCSILLGRDLTEALGTLREIREMFDLKGKI